MEERPAKRPRLTRRLPDGFAPSKPRPISVPVFVSGFDTSTSVASSSKPHGSSASAGASGVHPPASRPRPPNSTGYAPEFPRPDFGKPFEPQRPKSKPKFRVLKPPVWAPIAGSSAEKRPTHLHSLSDLRPVIAVPEDKPVRNMFRLSSGPPTVIMPPPKVPKKPLKPLPPPPVLKPKIPPGRLMPITKTPIALATDIHTESGLTELLSIYLQQHGTGYVSPWERELKRGLEQSPEKKTKAKNPKYRSGGLADYASRRFSATCNNHSLWELEIDMLFRKGRSGRPDVRLRITSIINATSPPTNPRTPHAPLLVLARCHVLSSQVLQDIKPSREILVLFRVSDNPKLDARAKERHVLAEGLDVYMYRPWYKVDVPVCNTVGAFGYGSVLGGSSVWFCQRYFVPPAKPPTL